MKKNIGKKNALYPMPIVKEKILTNGKIDYAKVKPILYDMPMFGYWNLGERACDAYRLGKNLRDTNKSGKEVIL